MRLRFFVVFLLLPLALTGLTGCEIINPAEDTPAYLQINAITLNPQKNATETYGSASNNIVDAWVFVNGKLLGAFELPATIPVLQTGTVKVNVQAGVYSDFVSKARFPYGFYTQYEQTVTLNPGEITEIEPEVRFVPTLKHPFDLYEDFTNFSTSGALRAPADSPYDLKVDRDTLTNFKFANGAVGVIMAKGPHTEPLIIESGFNGPLPTGRGPVFLELNYRTNVSFRVGLVITTSSGISLREGLVIGNPSPREWKQVYVNLTTLVNNPQFKGANFRVFIEDEDNKSNSGDFIALDNVRILSFN